MQIRYPPRSGWGTADDFTLFDHQYVMLRGFVEFVAIPLQFKMFSTSPWFLTMFILSNANDLAMCNIDDRDKVNDRLYKKTVLITIMEIKSIAACSKVAARLPLSNMPPSILVRLFLDVISWFGWWSPGQHIKARWFQQWRHLTTLACVTEARPLPG